MTKISLDGRSLSPADVVAIARGRAVAEMAPVARERNAAAERLVRTLIERGDLLYGVTTGVGVLRSSPSAREEPGDHLLDALLDALSAEVTPLARELGSLGTGDLTVLAEIGAALGGEGECWLGDEVVPASEALAAHGLEPVHYGPRDGIAFMSSNAVSIGQAALVFHDASRLLDSALGVAALSYEAAVADLAVLDPRVHAARPHAGQVEVARRLRELLGSGEPRRRGEGRAIHD